MLHFLPPMNQTCFAAKQVVGGCRKQKVVAVSREKFFFFLQQNLYMLRVLPAQGVLVLQQVT